MTNISPGFIPELHVFSGLFQLFSFSEKSKVPTLEVLMDVSGMNILFSS